MVDENDIDIESLPKLDDEEAEVSGFAMGATDVVNIRLSALEGLGINRSLLGKLQNARVLGFTAGDLGGHDDD